jgi:hypothetical protein
LDEFGYGRKQGCPDRDAILIPFENNGAWLALKSHTALNNVVKIFYRKNR